MEVTRFADVQGYTARVQPHLLADAARHNLLLGILDVLVHRPDIYPAAHLWAASEGDQVVGAAVQTPPHNVVVAAPARDGVVEALVDAIADAGVQPPGVVGGRPEADRFAAAWCRRCGGTATVITEQGIYRLREVRHRGDAPGAPRRATADDLPLVQSWMGAFMVEAAPEHIDDAAMRERRTVQAVEDGGIWLWEDEHRVVSLSGVQPAPPAGWRVGPVYTPPDDRGHGYATSLVAAVSADRLAAGATDCFLHTDLANPTSNAIYVRIGYERVCDAVDLRLTP